MTQKQRALVAELRAADYPAAWRLSASAADYKLVIGASRDPASACGRSALRRLRQRSHVRVPGHTREHPLLA
jgi:hypothetical protein